MTLVKTVYNSQLAAECGHTTEREYPAFGSREPQWDLKHIFLWKNIYSGAFMSGINPWSIEFSAVLTKQIDKAELKDLLPVAEYFRDVVPVLEKGQDFAQMKIEEIRSLLYEKLKDQQVGLLKVTQHSVNDQREAKEYLIPFKGLQSLGSDVFQYAVPEGAQQLLICVK